MPTIIMLHVTTLTANIPPSPAALKCTTVKPAYSSRNSEEHADKKNMAERMIRKSIGSLLSMKRDQVSAVHNVSAAQKTNQPEASLHHSEDTNQENNVLALMQTTAASL
mmetsp:Transcript_118812/g.231259  ORF Transcript_118812/g.231259 Transcript_118812/m.231259 type:complete len:109 (+) Transcript_118812:400-726(+)